MSNLAIARRRGRYSVSLEVAGHLAMFARPDTGATPTSYPAPTWSATKGLLESIAFLRDGAAFFNPTHVEICRPVGTAGGEVRYQRLSMNYGGPLRKPSLMSKGIARGGSGMQLFATVLSNVIYRLYADVDGPEQTGRVNARHYLQDLFNRRVMRGQCYRSPRLGWSECTCSYWGAFRDGVTEVDTALTTDIPSMLMSVWRSPVGRSDAEAEYRPRFAQDVRIERGVLCYDSLPNRAGIVPASGAVNAE